MQCLGLNRYLYISTFLSNFFYQLKSISNRRQVTGDRWRQQVVVLGGGRWQLQQVVAVGGGGAGADPADRQARNTRTNPRRFFKPMLIFGYNRCSLPIPQLYHVNFRRNHVLHTPLRKSKPLQSFIKKTPRFLSSKDCAFAFMADLVVDVFRGVKWRISTR